MQATSPSSNVMNPYSHTALHVRTHTDLTTWLAHSDLLRIREDVIMLYASHPRAACCPYTCTPYSKVSATPLLNHIGSPEPEGQSVFQQMMSPVSFWLLFGLGLESCMAHRPLQMNETHTPSHSHHAPSREGPLWTTRSSIAS